MLVHQCRRRIATKQHRHNQQANILLLAVESLLEDVVPVAVRREVADASAVQRDHQYSYREEERKGGDIPHARDDLTAFFRARGGFEIALNGPVAEP
jgi:hypothetical protein